jgi:hypothetical protein
MNRTYYNHSLTKKYIVIIGSLFSEYHILKDGTFIKIPVSYAGKNKLIQRYVRRDISFKGVQMTLPRIAFEFVSFQYDPQRKLNRLHQFVADNNTTSKKTLYSPVPYNIDVKVSILANKNNDITQIVEQILPKFTPDVKISSNLIPENNINFDISFCLNNVYVTDSYEGLMTDDRMITWDFDFTLKAYYFREIKESKMILEEIINYFDFDDREIPIYTEIITANTI